MAARTVSVVGDLTDGHIGGVVRIPELHQPGADFGAPLVTVTGRYYGRAPASADGGRGWWWVDVRLRSGGALLLDAPVPASHPCFLVAEDPALPELVQGGLFEA